MRYSRTARCRMVWAKLRASATAKRRLVIPGEYLLTPTATTNSRAAGGASLGSAGPAGSRGVVAVCVAAVARVATTTMRDCV